MPVLTLFFLLLCIPSLTFSHNDRTGDDLPPLPLGKRAMMNNVPAIGYYDPNANGGSMLTQVNGTFPPGLGEPINIVLSGNSEAAVLVDSETNGGLRNYFLSFGFASECLGQHSGNDQAANLGDGHGYLNETAVIRWDYSDPEVGTCKETIQGGNHFRYWVQNGGQADSGAVFMAASYEMPIAEQHNIIPNGYNFGRDWLIGNATAQTIPTYSLTNSSTFSGSTSFGGYTYATQVMYVSGLLQNTSIGINHNLTVPINGSTVIDGLVAVINVKITGQPSPPPKNSAELGPSPALAPALHLSLIFLLALL